jgi:hypothetical protein
VLKDCRMHACVEQTGCSICWHDPCVQKLTNSVVLRRLAHTLAITSVVQCWFL